MFNLFTLVTSSGIYDKENLMSMIFTICYYSNVFSEYEESIIILFWRARAFLAIQQLIKAGIYKPKKVLCW